MAESSGFSDFGILPEGLGEPPEKIRCFFSASRIVGQYIATGIAAAICAGLIALFAWKLPASLSIIGCAAAIAGVGAIVFLATRNDYRWVELEGTTIRARLLYTGGTVERSIQEIESLGTMVYPVNNLSIAITESLLGRVKGVEIRFQDGNTPLRIMRADPAMTNAREVIEAIVYRMKQHHELDAQVEMFKGKPLVRSIHWKGKQPPAPRRNESKMLLGIAIAMTLMFGTILSFAALQDQERSTVASMPPHEIALESLNRSGPGANRHVTVTEFRPGGYAYDSTNGSWTTAWIALFPAGTQPGQAREIKAVLSSKSVANEAALRKLLQNRRITGICSEKERTSWGTTLGPNLSKSNDGCTLSSAWELEDVAEPPSESRISSMFIGARACFAVALVAAFVIFWKR